MLSDYSLAYLHVLEGSMVTGDRIVDYKQLRGNFSGLYISNHGYDQKSGNKAIEDGTITMEGKLPINPSGGLIGCGHPVGATGARQLLDAYKQVTNTAGDYQVEGASRVATLNIGGTATTNVCFIVGK